MWRDAGDTQNTSPDTLLKAESSHNIKPCPNFPRDLLINEKFWRDLRPYLERKGYMLRPRYHAGWTPSWKVGQFAWSSEDSAMNQLSPIMDATRVSDGELVILKRVFPFKHPREVEMTKFFSNSPLRSHPRNHCVPLLDTFEVPGCSGPDRLMILVFPCLREIDDPPMKTIGEAMEFFRQVFEGLQFMHSCHIAHRDAMDLNIMMDPKPMYPNMFHPIETTLNRNYKGKAKHYTRTARPPKYYFIDFGLSDLYKTENGRPIDLPIFGGDKSVPEFIADYDRPHNPFFTDIYYVGNMVREAFLNKTSGLEFMSSLVADMTQRDPKKRPNIDEVVERFATILGGLHWWTLRSRLVYSDESRFKSIRRYIAHWIRTAGHIILFRDALPRPVDSKT